MKQLRKRRGQPQGIAPTNHRGTMGPADLVAHNYFMHIPNLMTLERRGTLSGFRFAL